ncbi:MAG: single-stranded DNA-binding protein [Parcubacteria group bacterium]|nr:single-stranded DNA-binding protein [Parcubacteria group bacterium]|tara:strand:+ start:546 stop:992 length:447 start_codon:yes stop_codon:yes gene_type:complete
MAKGTVNKVIILGRLGQDPDIKSTAGDMKICNLSVATNEIGKKDQAGNREDVTEWHRCVLFGKTAENAGRYLSKGSQVYLEGRLQTRKWQDKETGQDRYSTEIVCHEMQFIGGKSDSQQQPSQQGFNQPQNQPKPSGEFDSFDDDIPF